MPEHGEYNQELKKWFCSYWLTKDEWINLHYYSPPGMLEEHAEEPEDKEIQ